MPKRRQPKEIWQQTRRKVWERDNGECVHCLLPVALNECNIDHIKSGKLAGNELSNLRTLCKKCHVLRIDKRHRGMISRALRDGLISPDWRSELWE